MKKISRSSCLVLLGIIMASPYMMSVPSYAETSDERRARRAREAAEAQKVAEETEKKAREKLANDKKSKFSTTNSEKNPENSGRKSKAISSSGGSTSDNINPSLSGQVTDGSGLTSPAKKSGFSKVGGKIKGGFSKMGKGMSNFKDKAASGIWYKPIVEAVKKGGQKIKDGAGSLKRRVSSSD